MLNTVERMGAWAVYFLERLGSQVVFLGSILAWALRPPFLLRECVKQIHFIGVRSLTVIILTASFTGMVLGVAGFSILSDYGSESQLGAMVAWSLIRELGPVMAALMVTGRAGSAIAAEIGIMRISEQLDALDTMALNPMKYVVVPKVLAALFCVPLLTGIFDVVGITGGYITGVKMLGVSAGDFTGSMEASVGWKEVSGGMIKSLTFGLLISWICCFEGYFTNLYSGQGAEGVGHATTTAVVVSSVSILIWNYFITTTLT